MKGFDVHPRIFKAHSRSAPWVEVTGNSVPHDGDVFHVSFHPLSGQAGCGPGDVPMPESVRVGNGRVRLELPFGPEGEYALVVRRSKDPEEEAVADLRLYALEPDLFALRPFRGDTHLHSVCSDGKDSPAVVAAACRSIGLDFMALTDHRKHTPSLEAIDTFRDVPVDLRMFPGEEVHSPGNPVHIVNFGGLRSVHAMCEEPAYAHEVHQLALSLQGLPGDMDPYPLASCIWCFDRIREAGGLGVFCHPYWVYRHRQDVPEALTDLLLERRPFDALEVIGGYHRAETESNALQVARYHVETARGGPLAIVGASDAHGCFTGELFGWYWTLVFAAGPEREDVISAVRGLRSVAVESLPGAPVRIHGPWRLVRFAHYLVREVFPEHDRLCGEEGRLMLEHAAAQSGPCGAIVDRLAALQGQVARLYQRLWAGD